MDRSQVKTFVVSGDEDGEQRDKIAGQIAQAIEADKTTLLDLVGILGEYLTQENDSVRSRGTECLAETLKRVSPSKLTKAQVSVTCEFLCDRIDDEVSLAHVVAGLMSVINMEAFSKTSVDTILDSAVKINMRKHNQSTRYAVFQLLELILTKFGAFLKTKGTKFIDTFVHLTTGEKDPRNLLISFNISNKILHEFDISKNQKLIEDLFDVTFCYFPITFEPPKNDPYGITAADLKQALRRSLSANGVFAEEAFPRLVEKLNSSSESVKKDTLETILACVKSYDDQAVVDNWELLWDSLKFEVLHGSDDEMGTIELSASILRAVGARLDGDNLKTLITNTKSETNDKLDTPESKMSIPAAKLALAIAESSEQSFEDISTHVIDKLLQQLSDAPSVSLQQAILQILILWTDSGMASHLKKYSDRLFEEFSRGLMSSASTDVALKQTAIQGLASIWNNSILGEEGLGLLITYLGDAIIQEDSSDVVKKALSLLVQLSKTNTDAILEAVFPTFLSKLPESEKGGQTIVGEHATKEGSIDFILSCLAAISVSKPIFETLIIRLLNKLKTIIANDQENTFRYPLAIISTFVAVVRELDDDKQDLSSYVRLLITPLFTELVKATTDGKEIILHEAIIDAVGTLSACIVRRLGVDTQKDIMQNLFGLFVSGTESNLSRAGVSFKNVALDGNKPFKIAHLFTATLAPLDKSVDLPIDAAEFINNESAVVAQSHNWFERAAYTSMLSVVVNKWLKASETVVERAKEQLASGAEEASLVSAFNSIETATAIARGLLMKNDNNGYQIVDSLLGLLKDEKLGLSVGKTMGLLIGEDAVVGKENGLIVRLLYRQRVFHHCLPAIVEGFKQVSDDVKVNFLTALGGLLRFLPAKVVVPELPKFLPLLLESISLSDAKVQEAAIDTIFATQFDSAEILAQHISTIVPKLLETTRARSATVRLAALKCLGTLPSSISPVTLEPFRNTIITELGRVLDDPKRQIRREAVNCRQNYFEM